MLLSSVAFALMGTLCHALGSRWEWPVIALARSAVPLVAVTALALAAGVKLAWWRPALLWAWSLGAGLAMLATFFALTRLPVADVLTLTNMYPIWVALLSWPLLRQRPSRSVWLCAAGGVAGVALMQRPHFDGRDVALLAAVAASLTSAVALLALHRLKDLDGRAVIAHFSAVALLLSVVALLVFGPVRTPAPVVGHGSLLMLAGVGATAVVGQVFLARALASGPPAKVSVVGLTQVVFALALDVLVFGGSFSPATLVGMALVVAPTGWVMAGGGAKEPASKGLGQAQRAPSAAAGRGQREHPLAAA